MTMSTLQSLHSSREAADILELTEGRIRQICRWSDGKIGKKIGRDWFLAESDLELIRIKFPKKSSDE
jgi:hypothetical protein